MTHTLAVAGDITSGLTHFALAGISLIARSLTDKRVTTHWTQDSTPRAVVQMEDATPEQVAEQIKTLSARWAQGWTSIRCEYKDGKKINEFSPFSPRFKAIDPYTNASDWLGHQRSRTSALDELDSTDDYLALQLINSLGEAAYWRFEGKDPRPDHGASRWEMKTRNRGEEFISQKLYKYVEALVEWSNADILAGLQGERLEDPFGKDDSRTPSGFTLPGQTDLALAFVALLGIGQFPPIHRIHKISVTPGAYPSTALHTQVAVLPVTTTPVTPERFESLVLSKNWDLVVQQFASEELGREFSNSEVDEARAALACYGVAGAAVFRVHLGGSSTAPERYFEQGKIRLL